MSPRFRLILFKPDPFSGLAWPIGAVVQEADGQLISAAADQPPEGLAVSPLEARLAREVWSSLGTFDRFDTVPSGFGPYFALSEPRDLPTGVEDAGAWLRKHVLPRRSPGEKGASRAPGVKQHAQQFFSTYGVQRYVKKRGFKAEKDWGGRLQAVAHDLEPISQWTASRERLLLLEPIVPGLQDAADIRHVATRTLAWRSQIDALTSERAAEIVIFVLAGGARADRVAVHAALEDRAHRLVDVMDAPQRRHLVDRIRAIGQADSAQPALLN